MKTRAATDHARQRHDSDERDAGFVIISRRFTGITVEEWQLSWANAVRAAARFYTSAVFVGDVWDVDGNVLHRVDVDRARSCVGTAPKTSITAVSIMTMSSFQSTVSLIPTPLDDT